METEQKEVVRSTFYLQDIVAIFEYGSATFGERAGLIFYEDLKMTVRSLEKQYFLHPECRHLETKNKIYRNIIIGSYLIIYRITLNRIEVLRAFHGSRSPKEIKSSRKIKI
jgi:plasmid stabilization system protein ParE